MRHRQMLAPITAILAAATLVPGSRERAELERASIEIACDGLEIVL